MSNLLSLDKELSKYLNQELSVTMSDGTTRNGVLMDVNSTCFILKDLRGTLLVFNLMSLIYFTKFQV